ncbi:MAG: chorismate-binding protein [Nonlabens sp.]
MKAIFFDQINHLLENDMPFFLLRKSGDKMTRLIHQLDQKLHKTRHDNMTCAVFSKFEDVKNQVFIHGEVTKQFNIVFNELEISENSNVHSAADNFDQKHHEDLVFKAISAIKNGLFQKVVLSRKREFQHALSYLEIIENLFSKYPMNNTYFFHHPKIGTWCGATPEILLSIKGKNVQTMSLAGTAIYHSQNIHEWGAKEIEEQQIVTQSICQDLEKSGAVNIEVGETYTSRSGDLIHLKSDITAKIEKDQISHILNYLHPTPAVCGLPKKPAKAFILSEENYDRSYYTGYLGLMTGDFHDYYVNLRSMQLKKESAIIYAGGGITALSNPRAEYLETENKMKTMLDIL